MKVLLASCVAVMLSSVALAQAPDLSGGRGAFVPIPSYPLTDNLIPHADTITLPDCRYVADGWCLRSPSTGTGHKQNTPPSVTILRGSR